MATIRTSHPVPQRPVRQVAENSDTLRPTASGGKAFTLPVQASILPIEQLAVICRTLREQGLPIVHCHGAFDLLHPGHIKHLQAAKAMGDVLVVTLTADRFIRKGAGRPAFHERLRAESIAALRVVDYVAIAPWPTGVEAIEQVRPHVYVKGQDYADRSKDVSGVIAAEEAAVQRCGGKLAFTHEVQFSSTKLLNEYFSSGPRRACDEADSMPTPDQHR